MKIKKDFKNSETAKKVEKYYNSTYKAQIFIRKIESISENVSVISK